MLVLALDTSTRAGSVAVARDGDVLVERIGDATRMQAERLPDWLIATLAETGHTLPDVDRLAVLSGPGGFTGLRVGLATVQGLALGLQRDVFVASTLEVLAWGASLAMPSATLIGAWMRGMRGEVFTAAYRRADDSVEAESPSGLVAVLAPLVDTPTGAAARWAEATAGNDAISIAVTGDAWDTSGSALCDALQGPAPAYVTVGPWAGLLARLASRPGAVGVAPHAVAPTYIRRPDAVLTRERSGVPVAGV